MRANPGFGPEELSLELKDLMGKTCWQAQSHSPDQLRLPTEGLKLGYYLLSVVSAQGRSSKKIMIY